MFFKRKKKKRADDNQLLLFSNEEMSGGGTPIVDEEAQLTNATAQEKPEEDLKTEGMASGKAEDTISGEPIVVEPPEVSIDSDPFAPFIDDPASTSERIIHEMKAAMTLLDRFGVSQVRLIAMQAAPIVQSGVDFSKIYQLPSLPGFSMSGYSMLALSYVSFMRVFPGMIDRLDQDLTQEYATALRQYKSV